MTAVPPSAGPSAGRTPPGLTESQRRSGRRFATIVFLAGVASWVVGASAQIVKQALWPDVVAVPYKTCGEGLESLHAALARARGEAEGELDPDEALRQFREALNPGWSYLSGVRASCQDPQKLRSLDALERLRYAEEHAVRREAAS